MLTNFRGDKQLSMLRFGDLLSSEISGNHHLEIEEFFPQPFFSKVFPGKRWKKWGAYFDKYLLFPQKIKNRLQSFPKPIDLVHIIDHSNSVYLPQFKKISHAKRMITCHDLIAIRTAQGEFHNAPQTSRSGKRLQRWIHNSLDHADYYACDSLQTKQDLARLVPGSQRKSSVLHLGTETNFQTAGEQRSSFDELPFNPSKTNYILHVGSAAWYKNRNALFKTFRQAYEKFPNLDLKLTLVGPKPQNEEWDTDLSDWFQSHQASLLCLNHLTEDILGVVYKHAKALVFPSHIEGFGWPPLEAATQGCPVITTRTGAISDLLGDYANYIDSEIQASIEQAVFRVLQSPDQKKVPPILPNPNDCGKMYYDRYNQLVNN